MCLFNKQPVNLYGCVVPLYVINNCLIWLFTQKKEKTISFLWSAYPVLIDIGISVKCQIKLKARERASFRTSRWRSILEQKSFELLLEQLKRLLKNQAFMISFDSRTQDQLTFAITLIFWAHQTKNVWLNYFGYFLN